MYYVSLIILSFGLRRYSTLLGFSLRAHQFREFSFFKGRIIPVCIISLFLIALLFAGFAQLFYYDTFSQQRVLICNSLSYTEIFIIYSLYFFISFLIEIYMITMRREIIIFFYSALHYLVE